MLKLSDIIRDYPEVLQSHKEHILREYLQYHILEAVFTSPFASKLCFIGGTALRLCYGNERFSEDLDFDNKNLSFEEFGQMIDFVDRSLKLKGFETDFRMIQKGAYHCYLKFPNLMYNNGLSPMQNTKILVALDTVNQGYPYQYDHYQCNKFETFSLINVASPSLLLAHKIFACFERKRMKGRDFFDIIFLLKKTTTPDYGFLSAKLGIKNSTDLKSYMISKCVGIDFDVLHNDVAPFLFQPTNQSVRMFPALMERMERGE